MKRFDWILATIKVNWANMTANRGAFAATMLFMLAQNMVYFGLWVVIFSKISSLRGWGLPEVAFLYACGAFGYGVFFTLFGGLNLLGQMIQNGELDTYMARPRSVLLSALLQRMRGDSMGDVITGIVMLALYVKPPMESLPLLLVLAISSGFVYTAFRLIMNSLAFFGSSGEAGENGFMAFIITSTSPQNGFGPFAKTLLFTLFPAGYVGLLPVEIMRHFRWDFLAYQLLGSAVIFSFSLWLFHRGLRRYASGNKFLSLR